MNQDLLLNSNCEQGRWRRIAGMDQDVRSLGDDVHSGKHTKNFGKSPCFMGKSTISMAMFNSYVSLPEGKHPYITIYFPDFPINHHIFSIYIYISNKSRLLLTCLVESLPRSPVRGIHRQAWKPKTSLGGPSRDFSTTRHGEFNGDGFSMGKWWENDGKSMENDGFFPWENAGRCWNLTSVGWWI